MTKLIWGQTNQKQYEAGIDHGVLYPPDNIGVVWNGIVSVEESYVGGDSTPYHFDGIKYLDVVSSKNYQATLTAFSAPEEFADAIGEKAIAPGFILTRQPRKRFGLSYRVTIGEGPGYKLHVVFNALASPNSSPDSTMNESPSIKSFSWTIDATPPLSKTYRPSAHFVFDSTKVNPDILDVIETFLYGSDTTTPILPSIDGLLDLVLIWSTVFIAPDVVTGLADLIDDGEDLYRTRTPGILRTLPHTHLEPSVVDGLYNYV